MNTLTIKQMQPDYRPDEKFLKFGAKALTGAELLAIIIRTGSMDETSVDLCSRILRDENSDCENVLKLLDLDLTRLLKVKGIGRVKALQIKAVAELSERISKACKTTALSFNHPKTIADYYMEQMRHLKREEVILLLLNTKCDLIKEIPLSAGTVNASVFSPREIFLEALKYEASNVILLHNHPSGNPAPSRNDILATKRVKESGDLMGIMLVDHIIIGDKQYISLREEGYLNE